MDSISFNDRLLAFLDYTPIKTEIQGAQNLCLGITHIAFNCLFSTRDAKQKTVQGISEVKSGFGQFASSRILYPAVIALGMGYFVNYPNDVCFSKPGFNG